MIFVDFVGVNKKVRNYDLGELKTKLINNVFL